jgi:cyclic pyranopterin phosphate synthase
LPPIPDRLGRPLRDLRISVTDRCNFRCPYCMPAEIFGESYRFLPRPELLSFEEIERLAGLFADLGVEKIRITGGEPLLRHQLPALVERLAGIKGIRDLALTSNGTLLVKQAKSLKDAGLQRVTVSFDSHDEDTFASMSGRNVSPADALEGIEVAAAVGLGPIKINCVVIRGVNDDAVVGLARHFKGSGHIVRFIEYMDVGTLNDWNLSQVVSAKEIVARIHAELPLEPADPHYRGEVARRYVYRDGGGEIGVISSVSQPFCGDCTRARLTTEGKLVTCLFAADGADLRAPLRAGESDEALRERIARVWSRRTDRYSEQRTAHTAPSSRVRPRRKLEMYQIGG